MDAYTISLLLGVIGLAVMALSSVGHRGAGSHRSAGSHRGHGTHGSRGSHGARELADATQLVLHSMKALLSPRVVFSVALGFGTAGLVLRGMPEPWRAAAALLLALLFERLFVTPLWHVGLRFASRPARTLEDALMDHATAVTAFDESGHGLVQLELDGHVVQVLGVLDTAARARGVKIRAGDTVCIEQVDAARNRCVVSLR